MVQKSAHCCGEFVVRLSESKPHQLNRDLSSGAAAVAGARVCATAPTGVTAASASAVPAAAISASTATIAAASAATVVPVVISAIVEIAVAADDPTQHAGDHAADNGFRINGQSGLRHEHHSSAGDCCDSIAVHLTIPLVQNRHVVVVRFGLRELES
jgi:hypothetical protein